MVFPFSWIAIKALWMALPQPKPMAKISKWSTKYRGGPEPKSLPPIRPLHWQPDADGLAGTLTSLMWIQPMQVAGKFGQIKVATVDTVSNVVVDMMGAGMYVGVVAEIPEAFGMAVPMIINAVTGYGDQQRNSDGSAAQIEAGYWEINSVEEAGYLLSISNAEGGYAFSIDDVKTVLGAYNPDFTVEDMNALYAAVSVEEIQARKAAN
jgi:hypothetical protein